MKALQALGLAILLSVAWPVFANGENGGQDHTCQGGHNCNEGGGSAEANADARARAAAHAGAIALGYVKGGDQYQKAYQSLYANFRTSQHQLGVVSNVGPQVSIGGDTFTYEASAASAIAPDLSAPAPTAGCRYSQGFSMAGSVIAGSGSIGHTTSEWDEICGLWMAAKQSGGDAKATATVAAYCLTMERAGVAVKECDGWREKLAPEVTASSTEDTDTSTAEYDSDPANRS